jgi:hypothetical protein
LEQNNFASKLAKAKAIVKICTIKIEKNNENIVGLCKVRIEKKL